jgi:hypothetical protein
VGARRAGSAAAGIVLAATLAGFAGAPLAGLFGPSEEQEKAVEAEVALPAYPQDENLIPFYVRATDPNRYFVDAASLAVAPDGTVLVSLIVRSPQGATTVRFEGLRCSAGQRKVYAIGGADRAWTKPRTVEWAPIGSGASGIHERVLAREYLCPNGIGIRTVSEGLRALRRGGHESVGPAQGN